ncbi:MAG: lipid II flippase MurJ, partial [Reyranellales bacterium]
REDTRTPLYIAVAAIAANIALNATFLFGTTLAQVGIALASSLSGWLNAALLAAVLLRRGQWLPDGRLKQRAIRMAGATAGMGAVVWAASAALAPLLAHANFLGVIAVAGLCVLGASAYGALGALLGVVNLSELRVVMRGEPGVRLDELRSGDPGEQP